MHTFRLGCSRRIGRAETGVFEFMPQELDVKLSVEEYMHSKEAFVEKGDLESLDPIWKFPISV